MKGNVLKFSKEKKEEKTKMVRNERKRETVIYRNREGKRKADWWSKIVLLGIFHNSQNKLSSWP